MVIFDIKFCSEDDKLFIGLQGIPEDPVKIELFLDIVEMDDCSLIIHSYLTLRKMSQVILKF